MKKRLGTFRFADYTSSWFAIIFMFMFSAASFTLQISLFLSILPCIYAIIRAFVILYPYLETFSIDDGCITVICGKSMQEIQFPERPVLIISYTDVCPPLAVRTVDGNQTHILNGKISVTILQGLSLPCVLEQLKGSHIRPQTVSTIRNIFDDTHYVYSFVCDQALYDQLVENKPCTVIVPKALAQTLCFKQSHVNVCTII